jgi:hypothetical protein
MQMLRTELDRARAARSDATDRRAQDALDGVILALDWAIEDACTNPPSGVAAAYRTRPGRASAKKAKPRGK